MKILTATLSLLTAALLAQPQPALAQPGDGSIEAAPRPMPKKDMRGLFKVLREEPTIKQVQKWALTHYELNPSRINSMSTSARLKGLVPELDLSFENNQGNTFGNMRDGLYPILPSPANNPNPLNLKERSAGTSSNNVLRVRAVWNLDRLVFNAEALDVKSLNSMGETLVREASTVYYSRRRLLASVILSPPEDPEELFYELTRLDEMTATLDALTGNKFGKKAWQWSESMVAK